MSCRQDSILQSLGIAVDNFYVEAKWYFLSHAHFDHMKGLQKGFQHRRSTSKIVSTQITRDLSIFAVHNLKQSDFQLIRYDKPMTLVYNLVKVYSFPSYHCDGSAMFLFEINAQKENNNDETPVIRIMYTGDFRFRQSMRDYDILCNFVIDKLYIDDTFDEVTIEYPSYEESIKDIVHTLKLLIKGADRIYIHSLILGIEPILRDVAEQLDLTYGLDPDLHETWRGNQLAYLLENKLDSTQLHRVNLGNHKKRQSNQDQWIIPTCTYFFALIQIKRKTIF